MARSSRELADEQRRGEAGERHGLLGHRRTASHALENQQRTEQSYARTGLRALLTFQGTPLLFLIGIWVVFMIYLLHPSSRAGGPDLQIANITQNATSRNPPAELHFIVPATKKDPNLCKLMISAGALGYPDPILINWNKTYETWDKVNKGSHLAKITGIHHYLQIVPKRQDEDIAVIVDGNDTWLQLRPQTLVDRYFESNKRANARIAQELGNGAARRNISQKIIFGVQKRCWPWTESDPPCYAAPYSTLPEKVYGPQTDTDTGDEQFPYLKFRPRYLNSGVIIGTIGALRKLFAVSKSLMINNWEEENFGSDQYIFSHIFGDQEVWREAIRLDSRNEAQVIKENAPGYKPLHPFNPAHVAEVRRKAAQQPDGTYEFGIGLDTEALIGLNTIFAENETDFLIWNDKPTLKAAETYLGVPSGTSHTHMENLPEDITDTVPPFWTFSHEPKLPRWKSWSEIPLFTNIWTGNVPAVIHHTAPLDTRKQLRDLWWHKVWYQEFSRLLYDAHIYEPTLPVAFGGYTERDAREYWPAERWHGGGRNSTMWDKDNWWIRFDDICGEFHEEVFGDGKGPWVLPDVH